jgi:acyl-CoA thioesterase-2
MSPTEGPAPGFHRHPEHRIAITAADGQWRASTEEVLLAESRQALILEESNHGTVIYFPRADVDESMLTNSALETTCPFKGRASYFRLARAPDGQDVAWIYPNTYDEVDAIKGYVAFYADRVIVEESVIKLRGSKCQK